MASNYPSDPRNAAPFGNPATPQSSAEGTYAASSAPAFASHNNGGNGNRRLLAGTELSNGRYKIEHSVAAGGMGAVYRALDVRFDGPCAVKEMLDDFHNEADRSQAVEWFTREAKLLLNLNHPCIPRVRDFFVEEGRHYLVMDFIEGRTLGEVLEKEGNISGVNGTRGVSEARARSWAQQVCSVLSYLHRQSPPIIFRDLKPSNIMVTEKDEVKLIDFGIARTFQQSTRNSTIIMTIGYAPPEQLHGMPEPRSDLYALGATLHRVLTHHDAANNKPTIFHFPLLRTLRPDISAAFEQVIARALDGNLEQRWASAADMERAVINLPALNALPPSAQLPTVIGSGPIAAERATPSQPISAPSGAFTGPASAMLRQAQDHINAGRVDQANALLQQAYNLEPSNPVVHKLYGQVFARRQPPQPDQALDAYRRSLSFNSNDAETHRLMGDVHLHLQRSPNMAIPSYTQALRLNQRDFESHFNLGKSYEAMSNYPAALHEYQEAALLDGRRPDIHYHIGQAAQRLNQWPMAEQAYVQVLRINPADYTTRFLLAQVYERESKLEDAWRECNFVVKSQPGNMQAQEMLRRLRAILRR